VERSGTNPANHPGPPPEYLAPEPLVLPPVEGLIDKATKTVKDSLDHHNRWGRASAGHDPQWAFELAHIVNVLAGRLQQTTQALHDLHRTYDKLVWGLYQSNETYVVARR
jgi:hypothetical protein